MKRMLTIILALIGSCAWADTETVNGYIWTYKISGDSAELYNFGNAAISPSPTGEVIIPSTLGGKQITSIGKYAFYNCTNLTSVAIPDSVTSIGDYAFSYCSRLASMTISDGVTNIGDNAFYRCNSLESFNVSARNQNYCSKNGLLLSKDGRNIMFGVNGDVIIPDSIERIRDGAFAGCGGIKRFIVSENNPMYCSVNGLLLTKDKKKIVVGINGDVIVPDYAVIIGKKAFYGFDGLTSVTMPNGVVEVEANAFDRCSKLISVAIGDNVKNIGEYAFYYCHNLKNVTIPDSVTNIGNHAFFSCANLANVIIGNGVATIGKDAFRYSGLTNVTIGCRVTNIAPSAFSECKSLSSFIVNEDNPAYTSSNGLLLSKDGKSVIMGVNGDVTIPCQVAYIGTESFCWCNGLTSVIIPESVISIEDRAFYGCSSLTNATMSSGLINIGRSAFSNCSRLMSVDIPESVTNIEREAFFACGGLTNVTMKQGVMSIGVAAFGACRNLTNITIPDSLTSIPASAFSWCSGLESVTIPNSVTNISSVAFEGCNNMTSVVVPGWKCGLSFDSVRDLVIADGADKISYRAFSRCYNLTSVTIPYGLEVIADFAFEDCRKLNTVIIPSSVTKIGENAFSGCTNVTSVVTPGHKCGIPFGNVTSLIISDGTTHIGKDAFTGCDNLINVTIPDSVTSIETDAFKGCNLLRNVYLPNEYNCPMGVFPSNATFIRYKPNPNVYFDAAGGNVSSAMIVARYGFMYGPLPVPVRAGYSFVGWEYAGELVSNTTPVSALGDHTLIARWNINRYRVTFDANGGFGGWSRELEYGALIEIPSPNPTKIECSFEGWIPNVHNIVPASNVTYIAKWKVNQYKVTFDANGGCGGWSQNLDYGVPIIVPHIERIGYVFDGWSATPELVVPGSNVTYIAKWKVNQYKVTFDANGGDGGWSRDMDYGADIIAPNPTRNNYKFEGWMPNPDATVPAHDVTYVAQWKVWDVFISSNAKTVKELYPNDYQRITNVVIAASVRYLPENFFDGCEALENVTFVSPDTELGNNDLRKVGKLFANQPDGYWIVQGVLLGYKGVCPREIPGLDSVKRIIGDALEGCTALEELIFTADSMLTTIGTNAFKQCTELRQMTLPPSLTEIGDEAFMGCSYLGNVIVPGSVKKVGDGAFKNCTGFTAAQIEYGVESLGDEAFYGDWRISEVDIPSTVTNIGINAFGGDSSIIRIGLRGDVRKASDIFSNYKFIREATVKEGTGKVVDGLFSGFEKLRDVRFFGNCPQLENEGQLLYAMTPGKSDDNAGLTTYVEANSTGWDGTPGSHSLPQAWPLVGGSRRAIAYWDVPSYLCQFESNGGTLGVQDTYQYSEKPFVLPPEPVQSGYKFAGWWTKPVGGLHVTSDTIFIEGVYTMLYAHWIKGHWVFLNPNGGTVVNDYITYIEETTYGVLPSPVRSGYAFNGWLYNDIVIEPTTVISDKNDHTLVAQWTANLYSVRYHANGGVGSMDNESRTYGVEKALRKNIFVNEGYTFVGWATNETDEIIYSDCEVVSNMTAVANGWIDLYAVWEGSDVTPDPSNLNFYFSGDANWERCAEGVEVEKDGETVRFDSVWKSGFVTNNQASVLAADVYGAGKIGFWWKVSCESFRNWKLDNLEFAIDGVPQEPWINGETDWQYLEFEVNETGAHTLTWTYSKDESDDDMDVGEDCGRITAAVWAPSLVTLGDYLNCPRFEFRSSGDAEWIGDRQVNHDGIAALRSGEIGHDSTTKVEVSVDGDGRIGFWWKVSSEEFRQFKIDYVSFKIDGIEQAWIGGEVDWTNVAFNVVGAGMHTLSWEYHKDSEGSAGEDCAWLDEVVWMPSGGTVPELTPEQAAAWVSNDLAARYAEGGESAADYKSRFEEKFGTDPVVAMARLTGKKDAQGNDMYVWQDYVAGTDPTDTNSLFTATIKMVDGAPVVEWSPKLSAAEEAKRKYTIYGRASLESGEDWHSPTNALDRFFTVGVEMK